MLLLYVDVVDEYAEIVKLYVMRKKIPNLRKRNWTQMTKQQEQAMPSMQVRDAVVVKKNSEKRVVAQLQQTAVAALELPYVANRLTKSEEHQWLHIVG